jgi:hypothetical protein
VLLSQVQVLGATHYIDYGNFLPLSIYYRDKSNKVLVDSEGKSNIIKRIFYGLFKPVFKKAFSVVNI